MVCHAVAVMAYVKMHKLGAVAVRLSPLLRSSRLPARLPLSSSLKLRQVSLVDYSFSLKLQQVSLVDYSFSL
jgi:hypothetical protein